MRAVDRHRAKKEGPKWCSVHEFKDGPKRASSDNKNAAPDRHEKHVLNIEGLGYRLLVF